MNHSQRSTAHAPPSHTTHTLLFNQISPFTPLTLRFVCVAIAVYMSVGRLSYRKITITLHIYSYPLCLPYTVYFCFAGLWLQPPHFIFVVFAMVFVCLHSFIEHLHESVYVCLHTYLLQMILYVRRQKQCPPHTVLSTFYICVYMQ